MDHTSASAAPAHVDVVNDGNGRMAFYVNGAMTDPQYACGPFDSDAVAALRAIGVRHVERELSDTGAEYVENNDFPQQLDDFPDGSFDGEPDTFGERFE